MARQVVGKGLTLVANRTLTRAISVVAGPIGWAVSAIWTAFDLASPAYRVTVPCVIQIAYMRQKLSLNLCSECGTVALSQAKFCHECGAALNAKRQ